MKFMGFGAMDVTKPYKFTGFGAMDVTKPYKFIGCGTNVGPGPGRTPDRFGSYVQNPINSYGLVTSMAPNPINS